MTAALEGGEWSAARSGRTLPTGKTRYLFYKRLGGPQGRSGQAENLIPTGMRSRTVQPVAQSLYRLRYRSHKATNTHSEYVILIAIPLQQWLQERTLPLHYVHCLSCKRLPLDRFFHPNFCVVFLGPSKFRCGA